MTAVSRRRGTLRQLISPEGANWAGNKFREFQSDRTFKVISQKKRQTTLSVNRGTTQTVLESPKTSQAKIFQVYINVDRGTKRILLKIQ